MSTAPLAEQHRQNYLLQLRRRQALKLLGLSAVGLAVGGGTAWAQQQVTTTTTQQTTLSELQTQLTTLTANYTALQQTHAALQTQAATLENTVGTATARNNTLTVDLASAQQTITTLTSQLESLRAELATAQTRNGEQATLLSMFDQLDQLGLDTLLAGGLSALLGQLAQLLPAGQLVKEANAAAHGLLTSFETTLADLTSAMAWLGEKLVNLKVDLWLVENTAQKVTNAAAKGVLTVFGGFAGQVLSYLPFNMGDTVRQTFTATQGLLTTLVTVAEEANDQVLLKISPQVAGPRAWPTTLVKPLRDTTLATAEQFTATVEATATTIQTDIVAPAQTVLAQRQTLRETIAAYRAAHQL